jgi:hypothetical protein
VFFENTECLRCGQKLAFDAEKMALVAFDPESSQRRCANQAVAACNWLVAPAADTAEVPAAQDATPAAGTSGGTAAEPLCKSCRLTRTRPADTDLAAMAAFAETEAAKRRLVYQILDLGLPLESWADKEGGLGYDLLASNGENVIIGHADGLITIDLAETDDPTREKVRQDMGEAYRTMLGHLRHETGHYYWYVLVEQAGLSEPFRELFGDEQVDYQESINRHYSEGAPVGWEEDYVSAYATMHPWEDFAETFAHYLHIRDTLQTAAAYGVRIDVPAGEDLVADPDVEVEHEPFDAILSDWLPLTYALNALNRSMGNGDLYPFVLSPGVIRKLTWVHHRVTPKEIAHNKELASSAAAKGAAASNGAGGPHGGSDHTGRRSLLARLKASRR